MDGNLAVRSCGSSRPVRDPVSINSFLGKGTQSWPLMCTCMYTHIHRRKRKKGRKRSTLHACIPHDGGGSWGSVILSNRISSKELLNKVLVCLFVCFLVKQGEGTTQSRRVLKGDHKCSGTPHLAVTHTKSQQTRLVLFCALWQAP